MTSDESVTPALREAWQRVADCEESGNWDVQGPVYSGIGFLNSTWRSYGGLAYGPNAGAAGEDAQIIIGMRITGGAIPDQNGCRSW